MNDRKYALQEVGSILKEKGVSLLSEGIDDVALTPTAAKQMLAVLRLAKIGVTGAEVWKKLGNRFIPTYDICNIEKSDYASHDEYVATSLNTFEQQIEKYLMSQDEIFLTFGID